MRRAAPAEQGIVSHKALLRRKSVLGTDNALVGAEGASSAEFHSVLQIQHNTVSGTTASAARRAPTDGQIVTSCLSSPERCGVTQNDMAAWRVHDLNEVQRQDANGRRRKVY